MKKLILLPVLLFLFTSARAQNDCANDTVPPALILVDTITVLILPTGFTIVPALDLIASVSDDCSAVELGVRWAGMGTGFPENQSSIYVTCEYLGPVQFEVWARDSSGNTATAVLDFVVTDFLGNCHGPVGVRLTVCAKTETLAGIASYALEITQEGGIPASQSIDSDSSVCKTKVLSPYAAMIKARPFKNGDPLNGVSTYDLALISKHILNIEPLNSPYKMIAADADKSGAITVADIVQLRKLILGIFDSLPGNTSWRFVDRDFVFPNPLNPFTNPFPENNTITNVQITYDPPYYHWAYLDWAFLGLKVGDVNGSAIPNAAQIPEERSQMELVLPDLLLPAGAERQIPVSAGQFLSLDGLQLEFSYDPAVLELKAALSGNLPEFSSDNFNRLVPGTFRMAWAAAEAVAVLPGEPLFYLHVKAKQDLQMHDALSLEENTFPSELNLENRPAAKPVLAFQSEASVPTEPVIFPNPVDREAFIRFDQPVDGRVEYDVFNSAGQQMLHRILTLPAGRQQLLLNDVEQLRPGFYTYRLMVNGRLLSGKFGKQ